MGRIKMRKFLEKLILFSRNEKVKTFVSASLGPLFYLDLKTENVVFKVLKI